MFGGLGSRALGVYRGVSKIRGTSLGVIIRAIVCWGLYWGPLVLGNYHIETTHYYQVPLEDSVEILLKDTYKAFAVALLGSLSVGWACLAEAGICLCAMVDMLIVPPQKINLTTPYK